MRISIKTRLFTGIIVAILFVVALSLLSYYTSYKERESGAMVSHTIQVRSKLRDISINLKDYTTNIRTLRRYENATNLYSEITPATISSSVEDLRLLIHDNDVQQKRIMDLKSKLSYLFSLWEHMDFQAARTDQTIEKEYYSREVDILEDINGILRSMDDDEAGLLIERQATTLQLLDFQILANIGGTILILLIVLFLCIVINREFGHRLKAEKKLKENLKTLEKVNTKTNNYNSVLNGSQTLIAACQKAGTQSEFLDIMLQSIISFTQSPAAVVYLAMEEQKDMFRVAASHGIDSRHFQGTIPLKQFPMHPSEEGNVLTIMKEVPPDFWNISTAIGSSRPGSVAYLLLRTPSRIIGIIELGNFTRFTDQQIEYLEMIAPAISVRLAAVQIQESRDTLFAQLQEQQEILINQQEELRLANDELTQQTQILQASEEELRVQEEELKQINLELEQKNTAIESAREVLALKAAELETSGKYKSEFLANMSHELRTPLNSILILASLLKDSKEQNLTPKQTEYAAIIHKSGSDLLKLINDILDLSKIESGKSELNLERISLSSLQEDMHQMFYVQAEQNNIRFDITVTPDAPEFIFSDRQKLEQVLKNLLSNAFKFTRKKGSVSLVIRPDTKDDSTLLFEVKDTGIGIPEDKQAIVFEAFKQADGSTNRKYGGTGLGLSISRELAKILGGSIALSSREEEGSTFTVHLPVAAAGPAPPAGTEPLLQQSPSSSENLSYANMENINGENRTLLIIEDDVHFSSILRTFAEDRQYRTLTAFDGQEGLDMAQQHMPDAIILDMQLPLLNGWEVLKRLKADPKLKHIPVHIISASDDVQMPLPGAMAYLKKPVSKESLEGAFSLIGLKVHSKGKKVLIMKGATLNGELLQNFIRNIPQTIETDVAADFNEALILGQQQDYGCIIADIGKDIEYGIRGIEQLRNSGPFRETSVIIFIDKEISQGEEQKLKKISAAIVMNSGEAQRRLADEMELFLYKLEQGEAAPAIKPHAIDIETDVLKGKTVLLADDDMRNVFALVSLMEEHGMKVSAAGNGKEALDLLNDGLKPDIVLMDIMMPEMDGYEAMRLIRGRLQLRQLPIIAITAKAMAEDRELCIAAGASDYISKPVDNQKLLSLMRVWLSQ